MPWAVFFLGAPSRRNFQFRSREIMNFRVTRSEELVRPNPIPVSILITLGGENLSDPSC